MTDQTVSLPVPAVRGPVAPNAREIATMAAGAAPVVDTINIDKSSDVHIGPKIVSVVQNIDNAEKVKVRILGLELESKLNRSRRLRCSLTVFLCWAMVVCLGLAAYVSYALLYVRPARLDIGINESWYIRRFEWEAIEDVVIEFLDLPVNYVIVAHSAVTYCDNRSDCSARVRSIQDNHIFRGFHDIGPNFLVGGNGYVVEGRGANIQSALLSRWNQIIIGIMFLGNYKVGGDEVDDAQINNLQILLDRLLELNILTPEYELFASCQIDQSRNPGPNIQDVLHKFPHWNPSNIQTCLRT